MPMNPVIRAQWVAWLLEHEGDQGAGALRITTPEGTRFCCLGGLCELATGAGIVTREGSGYLTPGSETPERDLLPEAVCRWAGLASRDPLALAELNDSGVPFRQIASLIEEQL